MRPLIHKLRQLRGPNGQQRGGNIKEWGTSKGGTKRGLGPVVKERSPSKEARFRDCSETEPPQQRRQRQSGYHYLSLPTSLWQQIY
jgi:hypothetical protein